MKEKIESLKNIAFYLEGIKQGKGNIIPLGTVTLENLWSAINHLQSQEHSIITTKDEAFYLFNDAVKFVKNSQIEVDGFTCLLLGDVAEVMNILTGRKITSDDLKFEE